MRLLLPGHAVPALGVGDLVSPLRASLAVVPPVGPSARRAHIPVSVLRRCVMFSASAPFPAPIIMRLRAVATVPDLPATTLLRPVRVELPRPRPVVLARATSIGDGVLVLAVVAGAVLAGGAIVAGVPVPVVAIGSRLRPVVGARRRRVTKQEDGKEEEEKRDG